MNMNINIRGIVSGAGLLFALLSVNASSSLLIYPVRVSFDETERSAEVTLSNTSSQTNTYRLSWQEKRAKKDGGYVNLSEEEAKFQPTASSMLRFSPRQVTLKAGERQVIKLKLRRPRDLAQGEYRSHLLFKAMPPEEEDKDQYVTSTTINIMLSFSIPVTIQQGAYDTQVLLKQANIAYKPSDGSRTVSLELVRKGLHSPGGDISAYWTAEGESEVLIAKAADYNIWTELSETRATLASSAAAFIPADGRLRIHYEGRRDLQGNTYLDDVIEVKRSQIIIEE
jgi:fimbrial chaperone protein